jgi:hypothetical protein
MFIENDQLLRAQSLECLTSFPIAAETLAQCCVITQE